MMGDDIPSYEEIQEIAELGFEKCKQLKNEVIKLTGKNRAYEKKLKSVYDKAIGFKNELEYYKPKNNNKKTKISPNMFNFNIEDDKKNLDKIESEIMDILEKEFSL